MAYFTVDTFAFLRDLADHNDRNWFKANQERFERSVREPALDFITDFTGHLDELSSHFVADARKVGGSLFRIQRDTRFGADKTPYKQNTGIHFRHRMAKDAHTPGFYFHIEPDNCFVGGGIWRPASPMTGQIRAYLDQHQPEWGAVVSHLASSRFRLEGESLKRPPKGFTADHPLIDDLKRKSFIATASLSDDEVMADTILDDYSAHCRTVSPLMACVSAALGVPY